MSEQLTAALAAAAQAQETPPLNHQQIAAKALELANNAHRELKISPTAARRVITESQEEINALLIQAKRGDRRDVLEFVSGCGSFVDSLGRADRYSGAYQGGLTALTRRSAQIL